MAAEVEVRPLRYVDIAASATTKLIGSTDPIGGGNGSINDIIESVLIVPEAVGCGAVTLIDGNGLPGSTSRTIFFGGGTTALSAPVSWTLFLGFRSQIGPWSITTGASVHVIASGRFT